MSRERLKGPMITIRGTPMRALPNGVLMQHRDALSEEVLFWREQVANESRSKALVQGELEKAEATIRNQDVELRRLRRRVAELESGPADEARTRIAPGEGRGS